MERVWQRDDGNHAEATSGIADYIVSLYNNVRLHSNLGNLPHHAFEQPSAIERPVGAYEITGPKHAVASKVRVCTKAKGRPPRPITG